MDSQIKVVNGWAVAAKDLSPGEVVLWEPALICAPGRAGKPVCLACYSLVDGEYYCTECGWQLCSEYCQQTESHHRLECGQYKEKNIEATWDDVETDTFVMDFMGAYRLLLVLQNDPAKRKELLSKNMDHERRQEKYNSRFYVNCEQVLMRYIRDTCGIQGYSDDEILTALGLMEMYGTHIQNGARALHASYQSFQHCCVPNTYCTINPDLSVTVRASVAVRSGSSLTRSLVDPLTATQLRRKELDKVFLIDCQCERCNDPTELGTNLGGIHDPDHGEAVFLPTTPLQEGAGPWTSTSKPGVELNGEECAVKLSLLTKRCDEGLAEMGGSTLGLEFVLSTKGEWDILPKNGQVMLGVKYRLISGWDNAGLNTEKLHTKISYCEEILSVLSILHPGRNYTSAMLHYEAACASLALAQQHGDRSVTAAGAVHAATAGSMCDGEHGNMYQALREYVLGLEQQLKEM